MSNRFRFPLPTGRAASRGVYLLLAGMLFAADDGVAESRSEWPPPHGFPAIGGEEGGPNRSAIGDPGFMEELLQTPDTTFWGVARRLAEGGQMAPLVSRGIVSQVTSRAVLYDAETTSGGSGGPVLSMDGRVVAVNAAVIPEFGGANMGVPAPSGSALLERIRKSEGDAGQPPRAGDPGPDGG